MKRNFFKGTITALVTPFKKNGSIDFKAFEKLIDNQIKNKVDGILVAGSTGESATLTTKEKMAVIIRAVDYSARRIKVIAGTGTNETHETLDLTTFAKEEGADAALIVAPYYNKPTQDGLYEHFRLIATTCDIPQIIYNVPGRTGINILPETQLKLAENCPNIIGTKEASGNLNQMMEIIANAPENFNVMSGDDALTLSSIAIGAKGCVSVISNYAPAEFSNMINFALKNKFKDAMAIHYKLLDLMNLNFIESNPIPVKFIMSELGFIKDVYRMPLFPLKPQNKKKIKAALKEAGIK